MTQCSEVIRMCFIQVLQQMSDPILNLTISPLIKKDKRSIAMHRYCSNFMWYQVANTSHLKTREHLQQYQQTKKIQTDSWDVWRKEKGGKISLKLVQSLAMIHNRSKCHFGQSSGQKPCWQRGSSLFWNHLRVSFKGLMMAGSTLQVIEVADAFCHLCVISLSQCDM